jgi:hypothetical protein
MPEANPGLMKAENLVLGLRIWTQKGKASREWRSWWQLLSTFPGKPRSGSQILGVTKWGEMREKGWQSRREV